MKECPKCLRCWDDDAEICSNDDARLHVTFVGPPTLDSKYRLDQRLGQGGMGVVYRAHHLALQKPFALKLISKTRDDAFLTRFRIEAEALGKLKHPNIVDVTDFGIDSRGGGFPYLVMEYLEGSTLADRCRRGPLPVDRALPIFESIAKAIDHAHDRGILHLDLKPGNVFVSENESGREAIKILDFGLARFVVNPPATTADVSGQEKIAASLLRLGLESHALDNEDTTRSLEALSADRWFGTVAYMAPEVLQGEHATRASDIYSFGILIYEVLAGRRPFQGALSEVIAGHCAGTPPPPSSVHSALPIELDTPVLTALEKVPARRPKRALDVVGQIQAALSRARVRTWRNHEIPRRLALTAVAAVVLPMAMASASRLRIVQDLEHRSVDARFLAMPSRAPDSRLVLLSVDEASLSVDPTPLPEKADEFGRELARVFESGARGVAIDFLLPEVWSRSKPFSDLILRHSDALTLAALSSPTGVVVGPECLNPLTAVALGPQRASDLFAFVNLDEDPDGVTRRARLSYVDQSGRDRGAWATRAVRSLGPVSSVPAAQPWATDPLLKGDIPRFWIDYSVDWRRFQLIAWKDLAATLADAPEVFHDRLVIVGGDFGGDDHRVPTDAAGDGTVSGLALQALIANTILAQFPVHELARIPYLVGTGVGVTVVMLTVLLSRGWLVAISLLVSLIPLYLAASFLLFLRTQTLLPIVVPLLTAAVATLLAVIFRVVLPGFPVPRTERS